MTRVRVANESDKLQWDQYLTKIGNCHHSYCWAWREIISQSFAHTPYYLIADEEASKQICAVLPTFHVKSLLFGSALISMPYLNGGGILADSPESFEAIKSYLEALGRELNVEYIELRHRQAQALYGDSNPARTHKTSTILPLKGNPEEVFSSFKPKLRSQIRRPTKSAILAKVVRGNEDCEESIEGFFDVFSQHMRDLGTPVFPKKLFSLTCEIFGPQATIITAWHEKKCVAAGITIRNQNSVEIPWASSLRKYSKQAPNMLMYWEAIKTAALDKASEFDFGRSSHDSGTLRFKTQWGGEPLPLHWYYLGDQDSIPDINPQNPKFEFMVNCWRKLPVFATRLLGPWITRSLP